AVAGSDRCDDGAASARSRGRDADDRRRGASGAGSMGRGTARARCGRPLRDARRERPAGGIHAPLSSAWAERGSRLDLPRARGAIRHLRFTSVTGGSSVTSAPVSVMSGDLSRRSFLQVSAAASRAAFGEGAPRADRSPGGLYRDVREFGAVGDGHAPDTAAIQRAIDATHADGGGMVWLPPGAWRCGTLRLHSHVTVELGPGAVLCATPDDGAFDARERLPFPTGSDHETTDFAHALLAGCDLERVTIRGAGVIDMGRRRRGGPKALALKRCRFVTVQGVTILHAPNYCVSLGGRETAR